MLVFCCRVRLSTYQQGIIDEDEEDHQEQEHEQQEPDMEAITNGFTECTIDVKNSAKNSRLDILTESVLENKGDVVSQSMEDIVNDSLGGDIMTSQKEGVKSKPKVDFVNHQKEDIMNHSLAEDIMACMDSPTKLREVNDGEDKENELDLSSHFVNGDISQELYDSLMIEEKTDGEKDMTRDSLDSEVTNTDSHDVHKDSKECEIAKESLEGTKSQSYDITKDSPIKKTDSDETTKDSAEGTKTESGDTSSVIDPNFTRDSLEVTTDNLEFTRDSLDTVKDDCLETKRPIESDMDTKPIERSTSLLKVDNIDEELAIQNVQLQVSIADESIRGMSQEALSKSFSLQCSLADDSLEKSGSDRDLREKPLANDSLLVNDPRTCGQSENSFAVQCSILEDSSNTLNNQKHTDDSFIAGDSDCDVDKLDEDQLSTLPKMTIRTPAKLHSESFGAFTEYNAGKEHEDEKESVGSQDSGMIGSQTTAPGFNPSSSCASSDVFSEHMLHSDLDEDINIAEKGQGIVFKEQNYLEISPEVLSASVKIEKSDVSMDSPQLPSPQIVFTETQFSKAMCIEKPSSRRSTQSPLLCGAPMCDRCSPVKCPSKEGKCAPVTEEQVPKNVSPGSAWDEWSKEHNQKISAKTFEPVVNIGKRLNLNPKIKTLQSRGMRRSVSTPNVPVETLVETTTFKVRKSKLKTVESKFAPGKINELTRPSDEPPKKRFFGTPVRAPPTERCKLPGSSPAPFANRALLNTPRITQHTNRKPDSAKRGPVTQKSQSSKPHSSPARVLASPLSGSRNRLNAISKSQKKNRAPSPSPMNRKALSASRLRLNASAKVDTWRTGPKARNADSSRDSPQSTLGSPLSTPRSSRSGTPHRDSASPLQRDVKSRLTPSRDTPSPTTPSRRPLVKPPLYPVYPKSSPRYPEKTTPSPR